MRISYPFLTAAADARGAPKLVQLPKDDAHRPLQTRVKRNTYPERHDSRRVLAQLLARSVGGDPRPRAVRARLEAARRVSSCSLHIPFQNWLGTDPLLER